MIPTASETTIVRVSKSRPLVGEREADEVEEPEEQFREVEAEEQADDGREELGTDHERLDDDRVQDLPAGARPACAPVANSRARCAIVIESEFAITKLPTKSAMPAKASRKPAGRS